MQIIPTIRYWNSVRLPTYFRRKCSNLRPKPQPAREITPPSPASTICRVSTWHHQLIAARRPATSRLLGFQRCEPLPPYSPPAPLSYRPSAIIALAPRPTGQEGSALLRPTLTRPGRRSTNRPAHSLPQTECHRRRSALPTRRIPRRSEAATELSLLLCTTLNPWPIPQSVRLASLSDESDHVSARKMQIPTFPPKTAGLPCH